MTNLDPRIGTLNSGKFYAFANGYSQPETVGTLAEVEAALGLRSQPAPTAKARPIAPMQDYTAILTSPSGERSEWTVAARNKTEARAEIAARYRENYPTSAGIFYTFAQQRLAWVEAE